MSLCSAMSALGQKRTFAVQNSYVRFTPNSGHVQCNSACPLCANSGHRAVVFWSRYAGPVSNKADKGSSRTRIHRVWIRSPPPNNFDVESELVAVKLGRFQHRHSIHHA